MSLAVRSPVSTKLLRNNYTRSVDNTSTRPPTAMFSLLSYAASRGLYHLWTMILFTKSDIKTTVIPIVRRSSASTENAKANTMHRLLLQTILACASTPLYKLSQLFHVVFWLWFHVLQFSVSNQTLRPEEDEYNKKDRPLPAKRITLENARTLRLALVPLCLLLSTFYSIEVVYASISICFLTWIYDEAGFAAGHWVGRNAVNAMGLSSFEVGACLIAGTSLRRLVDLKSLTMIQRCKPSCSRQYWPYVYICERRHNCDYNPCAGLQGCRG